MLDEKQILGLTKLCERVVVKPGEAYIREGDVGTFFGIVLSGKVCGPNPLSSLDISRQPTPHNCIAFHCAASAWEVWHQRPNNRAVCPTPPDA